jgi:hypothetical protein
MNIWRFSGRSWTDGSETCGAVDCPRVRHDYPDLLVASKPQVGLTDGTCWTSRTS